MLFCEWVAEWQQVYKEPFVSSVGLETIKYCLNHILPEFGDRQIEDINGADLQRFLLSLSDTPNMQDKCRKVLCDVFKYAYRNRITSWDPMSAVKMKPYRFESTAPMNAEIRAKFVESLSGKSYEVLYLTYLYTGARRAELICPGGFEVDFDNRLIYIHGTKTEGSDRVVPLFDKLYVKLISLPDYKVYFESYKDNWVYLCFHRHMQKYFPGTNYCVRSLRCTFSLMCYELGVREATIQSWLGHSTTRTTNSFYLNKKEIALSRLQAVQSEIDLVNRSL